MATLRDIRTQIASVQNISKITSAMKMVAAAKMRRAQDAIFAARPYAQKLAHILAHAVTNIEDVVDPLFQQRDKIKNIALIVITADRGLCGGFNAGLNRAAAQHVKALKEQHPDAETHVITVGRKSTQFFSKRNYTIAETYPGIFNKLDFYAAQEISRLAIDGFIVERFDKVQIIVNEFKSVVKQEVVIHDFLPVTPDTLGGIEDEEDELSGGEYLIEPSQVEVLSSIMPKHLNMQIWRALLESNAAEQAARMVAMDNATINARERVRELRLFYNKARQAAITGEILEIVGGAEALQSS